MTVDIENHAQLNDYLIANEWVESGSKIGMNNLNGGVSAKTVWVTLPNEKQLVLKQGLEKLRVAADWYCSPERTATEARALLWLNEILPGAVPKFAFWDAENYILGMHAVKLPHTNLKTDLLAGQINPDMIKQTGEILGTIHRRGSDHPEVKKSFSNRHFFEVLRLEPYYQYTGSIVPATMAFMNALIKDTRKVQTTAVHGDYSPKNMLVKDNRIVLLDHEVMHLGDPAFDVGFMLSHLLSKANHLPANRHEFINAAQHFWKYYTLNNPITASAIEERAVRHTIGCLLARVKGRSPLEYLEENSRSKQLKIGQSLITNTPIKLHELFSNYKIKLNEYN